MGYMVGRVSDRGYCWQVMYDATGVRLQAGRQAEVCCLVLLVFFFHLEHCLCFLYLCTYSVLCNSFMAKMRLQMPWKLFLLAYDCNGRHLFIFFVLVDFNLFLFTEFKWLDFPSFWTKSYTNFLLNILWLKADHSRNFLGILYLIAS